MPNSYKLSKSKNNKNKKSKRGLYHDWVPVVDDEAVLSKSLTKRQMNLFRLPSTIHVFDVGVGWLKGVVYKQIEVKGFKIEYEVGDIKYCMNCKVDNFCE